MYTVDNSSFLESQGSDRISYKASGHHIGLCLRRLREIQGLSQSDLARGAEVNLSYVCSVENHPSNISIMKLMQLCNAMNIPAHMSLRLAAHDSERACLRSRLPAQWHQLFASSDQAGLRVADAGATLMP
jgi:transcriptional regulator with XRE-family HTH domain